MPRLHTFHFDIVTEYVSMNEQQPKPTPDDIRRTFTERGYHVDCYINYEFYNLGRCHVYSIPFDNERLCHITHGFPGGMFINVRVLRMKDDIHPFEHKFFAEVSRSFPLLSRLMVSNVNEQKEKHVEKSSIINFSHLVELDCLNVHIDYVEQFLFDSNTRLPCLNKIYISYEHLLNEIGNLSSHLLLRDLRSPGTNERRISYSNKKKPFTNFVLFDFILQIIQSHSSLSSSPLLILTSDQYRQVLDDYLSTLNITYEIIIYRQQTEDKLGTLDILRSCYSHIRTESICFITCDLFGKVNLTPLINMFREFDNTKRNLLNSYISELFESFFEIVPEFYTVDQSTNAVISIRITANSDKYLLLKQNILANYVNLSSNCYSVSNLPTNTEWTLTTNVYSPVVSNAMIVESREE
ncbi:unnamed protein product [Rotaria sp. Silwood1]|nr:unnamed protein product [Rotaria sp. Silwood1]